MKTAHRLSGNIVDVPGRSIFPGTLWIENGIITKIHKDHHPYRSFLIPGFIDAHVHIESSLLIPAQFARLAVTHGTVATVSDPHEIANVLGMPGIDAMLNWAAGVPFRFCFGAPSCVPASPFEASGSEITCSDIQDLFQRQGLTYLSEMMNYPGVIQGNPETIDKIRLARSLGRPVDGHAPALRGEPLKAYVSAGIQTDHETVTREEALEKLGLGMKIIIREGSAAKNFNTLAPLIANYPNQMMFCSDDKHPHELVAGNINDLVRRAVAMGLNVWDVLRCACINPVQHYGLDVGLLREGDWADCLEIENLSTFHIRKTWLRGTLVAENGRPYLKAHEYNAVNRFRKEKISLENLALPRSKGNLRVIGAIDGQVITEHLSMAPCITSSGIVADTERDLLKLVLINRYRESPPAVAFVHGFGLQRGALASSVAHDAHHIIAVGTSDEDLCDAINTVIAHRGGLCLVAGQQKDILPLPYAGLMSGDDGFTTARHYERLDAQAKMLGACLGAPFITLSFMGLSVIPSLKLTDCGLFDSAAFQTVPLCDELGR